MGYEFWMSNFCFLLRTKMDPTSHLTTLRFLKQKSSWAQDIDSLSTIPWGGALTKGLHSNGWITPESTYTEYGCTFQGRMNGTRFSCDPMACDVIPGSCDDVTYDSPWILVTARPEGNRVPNKNCDHGSTSNGDQYYPTKPWPHSAPNLSLYCAWIEYLPEMRSLFKVDHSIIESFDQLLNYERELLLWEHRHISNH